MDDMPRWYVPAYLAIKLPLDDADRSRDRAGRDRRCPGCYAPRCRRRLRHEIVLIAFMAALPVAAR